MSAIKNVTVIGASGSLGTPVLKALIDSKKFNVTALTRTDSKSTFPASTKVIKADYTSLESLTSAFKGQDAVISTIGNQDFLSQSLLIDAAIAAGVKRFLPSEFGSDMSNPKVAALPVFGHKVAIRKYLEEKVRAGADISYTYVINGMFLDWGLERRFIIDWKDGKPPIYDSGNQLFTTTTLATIGQGVVGVLSHPEETKNRSVYIGDLNTSQNHLLGLAKKVAPEKEWNPQPIATAKILEDANEKLAKGDLSALVQYILLAIFADGYGGRVEKLDNELLGLPWPGKSDKDLEGLWKGVLLG